MLHGAIFSKRVPLAAGGKKNKKIVDKIQIVYYYINAPIR